MADRGLPAVYSIAAHRGFADALVAGLVPRYAEDGLGLARLTLLVPSSRAARTITEAFVRHSGAAGLLLPRMVAVGDLDLDEALGPLFDSLGAGASTPPPVDPMRRWMRLAQLIAETRGADAPQGATLLRLARETGRVIDRLLVEEKTLEDLLSEPVIEAVGTVADHWRKNIHWFSEVQVRWQAELAARGESDAAARRNALFRQAARRMRDHPPSTPFVAAGVTSAAPALAQLLRTIAHLPKGAVILPDFDLTMAPHVWAELGTAGAPDAPTPFGRDDAVTHPQYHMKLLLNRMGIARDEVTAWHRAGLGKGPPERSYAISSLFLPPEASKEWASLPSAKRKLAGVRLVEAANPEEEAQAIALLVREAVETPERRVAVVTPDRALAGRVVHHLRRWNIMADDTAGQPLPLTAAGRVLLLLAEVAAERAAPVPLIALLTHPLVAAGERRRDWLRAARALEKALRGPRLAPGLAPLRALVEKANIAEWWGEAEAILQPMLAVEGGQDLASWLDVLAGAGEALCGDALWAREDGRALAALVEDMRLHARDVPINLEAGELQAALRDAMELVAVRPPYGGHPRVAIYGLLEARMTRADLVICAGLNEGTWPGRPATDPLLAPGVLRALGVPGADFRIGLAAHDLAGALGAPEVVLTRARRDLAGPAIPSRFLSRVRALMGEKLVSEANDTALIALARELDPAPMQVPPYPRPEPMPNAAQRLQDVSVTALDRLRSDPYQFYASNILRFAQLDPLDAEPGPAWQGSLAHFILEDWHSGRGALAELAEHHLAKMAAHPMIRALWRPRLLAALEWVQDEISSHPERVPALVEAWGEMHVCGVRIFGKADRIDRLADGSLAIVDYKTGAAPSASRVQNGYALQLGTLGLIARAGGFKGLQGDPALFEYWSLAKNKKNEKGFGTIASAQKIGGMRTGILPADFLPTIKRFLEEALDSWILGNNAFTARLNPDAPGYDTYDHLMRLAEWQGRETDRSDTRKGGEG